MYIRKIIHLYKCFECATLTEDAPNDYGSHYCARHKKLDPFYGQLKTVEIEPVDPQSWTAEIAAAS